MVCTPGRFTNNSLMSPGTSVNTRKPSERKSFRILTEFLCVKNKTAVLHVGAAKSKHKAIIESGMLWSSIKNRIRRTKINERIKKYLYN